jgi:hypothetical protein
MPMKEHGKMLILENKRIKVDGGKRLCIILKQEKRMTACLNTNY